MVDKCWFHRYPEIQDSLILFIRNSGERARIKKEFQEWSTAIARGELPHGSQGVLKLTAALIA